MARSPKRVPPQTAAHRAEQEGRAAAASRRPYDSNPYPETMPTLRLAWSQGHNGMRARMALDKERGIG